MENDSSNSNIAINRLTVKILEENMTILGVVTAVNAKNLIIILPGGLIGFAPVAENDTISVGNVICCKIKQISREESESTSKSKIILSIDPKEIYENLNSSDVKHGMIFQGIVESREDFGYVVDIGVSSIRAFLKDKCCDRYIARINNGQPLKVGQIIPCSVLKVKRQCVNLTCNPKPVTTTVLPEKDIDRIRGIIPGTRVTATITKVSRFGLVVSIGNHVGAVNTYHLENSLKTPFDYSIGQTVVGTILYTEPFSKSIYLSLRSNLKYLTPVDNELIEQKRKIIDGVVLTINEYNVLLNVQNKYHGICKKIHFSSEEEKLRVGAVVKCRVLGINYIDNTLILSMSSKHMSEEFTTFDDIEVGDVIEATIKQILPIGVQMNVTSTISGFVPKTHISDLPTFSLKKKFDLQIPIHCMVISLDAPKRQLFLSMKKSIVKSKYPILNSIHDAEIGFISDGTVTYIHENFVKVRFCGDVEGIVHRNALLSHNLTNPGSQLEVGQTMTCKVVFCSPEENKLHLNFVDFNSGENDLKITVGKVYKKCKVRKVSEERVEVEILPEGIVAFIANAHFSDHVDICKMMKSNIEEGDILGNVVGISSPKNNILSMKKSLVDEAKNKGLTRDYEIGEVIPSVIHTVNPDYVIVRYANGTTGKVNRSMMTEIKYNPEEQIGLSLSAKILNKGKKKPNTSTLITDCSDTISINNDVELLQNYLREREIFRNQLCDSEKEISKLTTMEEGKLVKFAVTRKINQGLIGFIKKDIPAVVTCQQMDDCEYEIGNKYKAVVVNVDLIENCVEINLKRSVVDSVDKNTSSEVQPKQKVNGIVLFIHPEYILVLINGQIGYIPTRKHLNDYIGTTALFTLGNSCSVVVDSVVGGRIFISTTAEKNFNIENAKYQQIDKVELESETLEIGRSYKAEITAIEIDHLQIKFQNGVLGQVFITDVTDSLHNGTNPLKSFSLGQRVDAIVCTLMEISVEKPENDEVKYFASCCLTESINPNAKKTVKDFVVGQRVICFVEKFKKNYLTMRVNRNVTGQIHVLNVSQKFSEILDAGEIFKLGDGYIAIIVNTDEHILGLSLINDSQLRKSSIVGAEFCKRAPGVGLSLKLPCGFIGLAGLTDIRDDFSEVAAFLKNMKFGRITRCRILSIDKKNKIAQVSLRRSMIHESERDNGEPELSCVSVGQRLKGIVKEVGDNRRVSVQLGRNICGILGLKDEIVEIYSVVDVRIDEISPEIILVKNDADEDGAKDIKRKSIEILSLRKRQKKSLFLITEKKRRMSMDLV